MEKNIYTNKIEGWLKTAENTGCDLCMMVYQYITACPTEVQANLFQFFAENVCEIESDNSQKIPDLITVGEVIDYSRAGIKHLAVHIDSLYDRGLDKDTFYKELWDFIKSDLQYTDDKAKSVAIFNCFKTKKVPYMDVSKALSMDSDEFDSYFDAAKESSYLKDIIRVHNFGFDQKTEKYSMMLDILESCDDVKMRTILLMLLVDIEEKRHNAFIDLLKKGIPDQSPDFDDDFDFSFLEDDD